LGYSYQKAIDDASERWDIGERQVKTICAKLKDMPVLPVRNGLLPDAETAAAACMNEDGSAPARVKAVWAMLMNDDSLSPELRAEIARHLNGGGSDPPKP
jgi:hypothetical protein